MAGRKLPVLPSLAAKPDLADEFYVVDVSDTSESPEGTSKKIIGTNLAKLGGFETVNNLQAVAAPTVTDDSDSGYSVGSLWGFGDNLYKCTDATVGAAVWVVYSSTPYKKYVALLTQIGTDAPVATVLENTLGATATWSRDGIGTYRLTATGLFSASKTTVQFGVLDNAIGSANYPYIFEDLTSRPDSIVIATIDLSDFSLSDGNLNSTFIEIRVYP